MGIVPNSYYARKNTSKMVPDRKLSKSNSAFNPVLFENVRGILPFRLLEDASKYSKFSNLPTSVGRVPVNWLPTIRIKTIEVSRPISVGIVPDEV